MTHKKEIHPHKPYCPKCAKELKKNERGTIYCPSCGETISAKDADRPDPRLAREAGMR